MRMVRLDSKLLDLPIRVGDEDMNNFHKPLQDITLNTFENDNECEVRTLFNKEEIVKITDSLNLPIEVHLYYNRTHYVKLNTETLVVYMLQKYCTGE